MHLYYLVNKTINYHPLSILADTVVNFPLKVTLAETLNIAKISNIPALIKTVVHFQSLI